jgi:uridine phosphorylase
MAPHTGPPAAVGIPVSVPVGGDVDDEAVDDAARLPALFHLGLRLPDDAVFLRTRFRTVKYVLLCGSANRAAALASAFSAAWDRAGAPVPPPSAPPQNLCSTDRYTFFQPHPAVLTASHGIGKGSTDILLHEITSALRFARATGFSYIRVGSCGGCGTPAGALVVSDGVVDETGAPVLRSFVLGQLREFPALLDQALAHGLAETARAMFGAREVRTGTTMCCETFYEAQGRLDGAIVDYSEEDRTRFLERCRDAGIVNFEMESVVLAAFCTRVNIPAAVVCAALVDRLDGGSDTPDAAPEKLAEWEQRPVRVAVNFVAQQLKSRAIDDSLPVVANLDNTASSSQ